MTLSDLLIGWMEHNYSCGHRFSPYFNLITPQSRLTQAISSCPIKSAVRKPCRHCPQRLIARMLARTRVLPRLDGAGGGGGLSGVMCTVMERSVPPDFVRVAQLRVSGNSSCGNRVNVLQTLSPAGANTLVDSCRLSVSANP